MRLIYTSALATIFSATVLAPARADQASDEAALRRIYAAIDKAGSRGDVRKISPYLTSDFKMRQSDGRQTDKKQSLQIIETAVKTLKWKLLPTQIYSMRVTGNRATIEASDGGTLRRRDAQGKVHTILILSSKRDQWIKVGGAWKQRFSEMLTQEVRVDDKVVRTR